MKFGQESIDIAMSYLNLYDTVYGDRVPTKAGLCRALQINKGTLYHWCEVHPDSFGFIVEQLALEKERQTINFGLTGTFNANIAKVLLAEDGYGDRTTLDISEDDMRKLTDAQLQYLAKYGKLPSSS